MIHALPGMGADRRMFPAPWQSLPEFQAHDWVRHAGEKSLAEVAQSVCAQYRIADGDVLIGASLGGMVACEITKIRRISALYLVGSAVRKEDVSSLLAAIHPVARIAPIDWLRFSAGKIPTELAQMFTGMEASFIRAMCAAVFQWEGLYPGARATSSPAEGATRVIRIHGRRDLVIPAPKEADLLLDGGHLISITHAEQCVAYITATLSEGTHSPNRHGVPTSNK